MYNILEFVKKYMVHIMLGIISIFILHTVVSFFMFPKKIDNITKNALSSIDYKQIEKNRIDFAEKGESYDISKVKKNSFPLINNFNLDSVLGGIYIPKYEINLAITSTQIKPYTNNSAVAVEPKQIMGKGNYILASNSTFNKKLLFTSIIYLDKGDKIYLTDKNKVYLYTVVGRNKVDIDRDYMKEHLSDNSELTLVTKYKNKNIEKLIVVKSELTSVANLNEVGDKLKAKFGN